MKYTVTYAIRGYFDVELEASSEEEAKEKAEKIVNETDFSNLIDPQPEMLDCWKE